MERTIGMPDTVCCRYNPGKFQITNDIMGHLYDSKFGMTKLQLLDAYAILKEKGVRHFGLHCMAASCSLENGYYPALARELFHLVCEIRDIVGVTIEFVDLSGSIGIPYRPEETAVDIHAIGEGVRQAYEEILTPAGISLRLCTEMGRYITGPYGHLVTTVIGKKHIYKEYVGVDATACDLVRVTRSQSLAKKTHRQNRLLTSSALCVKTTINSPLITRFLPWKREICSSSRAPAHTDAPWAIIIMANCAAQSCSSRRTVACSAFAGQRLALIIWRHSMWTRCSRRRRGCCDASK